MNKNLFLVLAAAVLLIGLGKLWCAPPPPPPKVDPNPGTISFGEVYVGQTARGNTVWTNNTNNALNMVSAGTTDAGFGFDATTFTAGNLAPGASTGNLTFTFSPTTDQVYNGKGNILGMGAPVAKVGLNGTGVYKKQAGGLTLQVPVPAGAAAGTPTPKFLDFGKVKIGTAATLSITVSNTTANNIQVTASWSTGGQGFAVGNPPGNTFAVPANGSVTVNITFSPTALPKVMDAVTFTDAGGTNFCGVVTQGEGKE